MLTLFVTAMLSVAEPQRSMTYPSSYPPPITAVSGEVIDIDRFERTFRIKGQSKPIVGVFSTRYAIKGKPVTPQAFWEHLDKKDMVNVKVRVYPLFSILAASNISIDN